MSNPFERRSHALSDPSRDIVPVTPDDATDLAKVAVALYVETGGNLTFVTPAGHQRTVAVADFSILPAGAVRVLATGTTATGIHAFTVS
ncbi:spike base protein, RCAP_Rcc01079 family [Aliiroseovarius crassostreae]|uniref:spike base protein, RCAP_Rcc01079 family n=1 Tax=Aliiroseovarius crassostreae TaxID=154981 RepID=UPI003C7E4B3B